MDLEKLKQMDNKNEQDRKETKENKMGTPINEWKAQLNSERFENRLQKELEDELNAGYRLSIRFTIGNNVRYYDYDYINLYGRFINRENYIIGVRLSIDDYYYSSDDIEKLAKSMYEMLKNKLIELGFIITKEDGEVECEYSKEKEVTLYLKVR